MFIELQPKLVFTYPDGRQQTFSHKIEWLSLRTNYFMLDGEKPTKLDLYGLSPSPLFMNTLGPAFMATGCHEAIHIHPLKEANIGADFSKMYQGEFKPDERMEALRNRYIQYYKDTACCSNQLLTYYRKQLKHWICCYGYTPKECSQVKKSIGPTAEEIRERNTYLTRNKGK